jgi:hypothetical protein
VAENAVLVTSVECGLQHRDENIFDIVLQNSFIFSGKTMVQKRFHYNGTLENGINCV